jgi:hypothetical protein
MNEIGMFFSICAMISVGAVTGILVAILVGILRMIYNGWHRV